MMSSGGNLETKTSTPIVYVPHEVHRQNNLIVSQVKHYHLIFQQLIECDAIQS